MRSGPGGCLLLAVLLLVSVLAGPAAAGPPKVGSAPPGFVDAIPEGPPLATRLAEIRRRVQAALIYPPIARERGEAGEVVVGFEVGADHRARRIRTAISSGRPSLDRAAERAVLAAAPLPYVYGRVQVPVRFELDHGP